MELIDITKRLLELKAYEIQLHEMQADLFEEFAKVHGRRTKLENRAVDMGIEFY